MSGPAPAVSRHEPEDVQQPSAAMLDGTFARSLAGPSMRRADTIRDERRDEYEKPVEAFLRRWTARPAQYVKRDTVDVFVAKVRSYAPEVEALTDDGIRERLTAAYEPWRRATPNDDGLAAIFALVGEGVRRSLGLTPHPVQYFGACTLLRGKLAEMRTGEGKTLVAAMAATAMARSGASTHVISTNDYLARRDSEEMSPLFRFFGLTAGCIQEGMEPDDRRRQYECSICYVTGKELVFDYLKDRMAGHGYLPAGVEAIRKLSSGDRQAAPPLIQALHFAIVDEADSILIDEARTPMIISRESEGTHEKEVIQWAIQEARKLREGLHYRITTDRRLELLPAAADAVGEPPNDVQPIWSSRRWRLALMQQALSALHLFRVDHQYIIADGKVQIVDESTGRVMPDRSWEQGLHQLIECKEGLELTAGRETIVRMTFQRFFRRYFLLAGLTGTATEAARELWSVYWLKVLRIPPNRPLLRQQLVSRYCANAAQKWECVADEVEVVRKRGQPVLVGTRSVEASEALSAVLQQRDITHVVLNARQDANEADIIKQAGRHGAVTVATNMAGRGTDIKLDSDATKAGGLHVILTEFHFSARVDRQLFGRSGRQGDPGSARAIVAVDDELFRRHAGPLWKLLQLRAPAFIKPSLLAAVVSMAQRHAEGQERQARMQTLRADQTLHRLLGFAGRTL